MLRQSESGGSPRWSDPASAAAVDPMGDAAIIDLRDRNRTDAAHPESIVLSLPSRAIPQRERRAVGRNIRALGHLLDAVALSAPFVFLDFVRTDVISLRVVALFVVVATALLWPTH